MKTKLMLIGLMMCVFGAPLWADLNATFTVSAKLVAQEINLDAAGPKGWVALAVEEPNQANPPEWYWAGAADLISPARPAMYKTADNSNIAFTSCTLDAIDGSTVPDDTTWRTTTNTNTAGTFWKWQEGSTTVIHKEWEAGGDKRFVLRSPANVRQKLFYNFSVTPIEAGVMHVVDAWFYSRGNSTSDVVLYEFYAGGELVGSIVPRSSNYFQVTLKFIPDSLADVKVSISFVSHPSQNTDADRGGVIAAALSLDPSAQINQQPESQTVEIGSDVEFSITAANAETYQWFKEPTTPVIHDGSKYSIVNTATTSTLTITNVQVAEEGFYYCYVTNNIPTTATSKSAQLLTKRLVGWWKLDNSDPNDSVQDRYPAAMSFAGQATGDPNYVAGINGEAIQLTAKAGEIVNMPGSSEFYNFFPRGYTVSAWVKAPPAATDRWRAFVSKIYAWEIDTAAQHYGYALMHDSSGNAVFVQRRNMGNLGSGFQICDDTWHLVTGTWNPSDMIARVYVDGLLRTASGVQTQLPVVQGDWTDPEKSNVRIGADGDKVAGELNSPFIGLVDDVRIYSYPLSPSEVYYLYGQFKTVAPACLESGPFDVSGPAGVPDCIVNLYDFAEFAKRWMACFIVPECL